MPLEHFFIASLVEPSTLTSLEKFQLIFQDLIIGAFDTLYLLNTSGDPTPLLLSEAFQLLLPDGVSLLPLVEPPYLVFSTPLSLRSIPDAQL